MGRVTPDGDLPPERGSELALARVAIEPGAALDVHDPDHDVLLFVSGGSGALGEDALAQGTAAFLLPGEEATIEAGDAGLRGVSVTVGAQTHVHAPMGSRERVVRTEQVEAGQATGSRSFQLLFGPHNGSTRATMFAGYIPPGRAPWHYHLYDEIVWVWRGPGRYHLGDTVEELPDGAAFRIAPREVHSVENTSTDRELAVLGIFTPAGSPSAAYLMPVGASTVAG